MVLHFCNWTFRFFQKAHEEESGSVDILFVSAEYRRMGEAFSFSFAAAVSTVIWLSFEVYKNRPDSLKISLTVQRYKTFVT